VKPGDFASLFAASRSSFIHSGMENSLSRQDYLATQVMAPLRGGAFQASSRTAIMVPLDSGAGAGTLRKEDATEIRMRSTG
jgi:hypothetical protein